MIPGRARTRFGTSRTTLAAVLLLVLAGGCSTPQPEAATPKPPKPITEFPVRPFPDAVVAAAEELFNAVPAASLEEDHGRARALAIDPLIDSVTGQQTVATRSMRSMIVDVVQARYPRLTVQPFTTATVGKSPLVLIGTLTAIDQKGEAAAADRTSYRIWLTLLDLRSGTIVAKARARAPAVLRMGLVLVGLAVCGGLWG